MSSSLYIFKIFVAGRGGVGKTAFVQRYIGGRFISNTKPTIGVDFGVKNVDFKNPKIKSSVSLQIWDMAGENRFKSIIPYYINGTNGMILCFSTVDGVEKTIDYLYEWLDVVYTHLINKIPILLIRTKMDLVPEDDKLNKKELQKLMEKYEIKHYLETSSLTGDNVIESFQLIATLIAEDLKIPI